VVFAGWVALRYLDEPHVAMKHFLNLYSGAKSVISKTRGAYWSGRAAEAKGDMAAATDWYRNAAKNLTVSLTASWQRRASPTPCIWSSTAAFGASEAEKAAFAKLELVQGGPATGGGSAKKERIRPFRHDLTAQAPPRPPTTRCSQASPRPAKRDDLAIAVAKEARQKGRRTVGISLPDHQACRPVRRRNQRWCWPSSSRRAPSTPR
jgi:soluble lytic murein transglycosylase